MCISRAIRTLSAFTLLVCVGVFCYCNDFLPKTCTSKTSHELLSRVKKLIKITANVPAAVYGMLALVPRRSPSPLPALTHVRRTAGSQD